ncbi:MAG: efflux RND transporter permease subunit [Pseudomonadota bacterium]
MRRLSGFRTSGLVAKFIRHPNAANLLMILLIVFGVFAIARINTQFLPSVQFDAVSVSISWPGASAEDVETNVLALMEPSVRFIDGVNKVNSYARQDGGSIRVEFVEGQDMQRAVANVEAAVDTVVGLPQEMDDLKVSQAQWFDDIARLSISGNASEEMVRRWAKRIRDDLIDRGIDRITMTGLRAPELQVDVPERELRRLDLTIEEINAAIQASSRDLPSGSVEGAVGRQLRTLADVESVTTLGAVEVKAFPNGDKVFLRDIATINDGFDDTDRALKNAYPAIEMRVQRSESADTIKSNNILQDYLAEIRPRLPDALELQVYSVRANAVSERIMLLVKNGLSGLFLVVAILFIFLNGRIAFWVAAGIPVALFATVGIMYVTGQTINMLSLFGLIMMLGIIVDDAIVVGEHTDTMLKQGYDPAEAAERGVTDMFTPVTAALTTTIATFAPMILIGGGIGQIIGVLPLVVIAVAVASIIECFFVLPGHLAHSLERERASIWSWWRVFIVALIVLMLSLAMLARTDLSLYMPGLTPFLDWKQSAPTALWITITASLALAAAMIAEALIFTARKAFMRSSLSATNAENGALGSEPSGLRGGLDRGFEWFREKPFNWLVGHVYTWRYVAVAVAIGMVLVVGRGMTAGGHVGFVFFPSPEADNISGSLIFHPGTPEDVVIASIAEYEAALRTAEQTLTGGDEQLLSAVIVKLGMSGRSRGENLATISVQLTSSEERSVRTRDIVSAWREAVPVKTELRRFSVRQSQGGPPGADIDVELSGPSVAVLKDAAVEVNDIISALPGVSGVEDDLPYGKPELQMTLTPRGSALGFTIDSVGRQVRAAFSGMVPARFARGDDEVTIRVSTAMQSTGTAALRSMELRSSAGNYVPLTEIVNIRETQGFAAIQRKDGKTTISISGDINPDVNTTDGVTEYLTTSGELETVSRKYGVSFAFGGRAEEQREAFADVGNGGMIALAVIYIILAWVFGSYFLPLAVIAIIPFGVVGAVFGHYLMDFQLTMLSVIGLLGLSGILVNDSIIMVVRLQERLRSGDTVQDAVLGASRDRLRAVLLTSLTTIGGLTPLLFETSLQAQFLLPMAITMVFGLATATALVLFLMPAFIGIGYDIRYALQAVYGDRPLFRDRARKPAPAE